MNELIHFLYVIYLLNTSFPTFAMRVQKLFSCQMFVFLFLIYQKLVDL